MSLRLRYAVRTDPGLVRQTNQDSVYAGPRLLAVADGMGGMAAGDLASSVVITRLAELDHDVPAPEMIAAMDDTVAAANQELHAGVTANPELRGMGTTLTALLISGRTVAMVHIGDSRAYLLRDGHMRQVTKDHTYVQMLVDEGAITAEEASNHPHRSLVTQVLQGEPIEPAYSVRQAVAGDRYLLCSDGLSNVVTMETMADMLREYEDPEACAERLIDLALRAGGPDNITAIVADILEAPDPGPAGSHDADQTHLLPAVPAEDPPHADQPGTPRLYLSEAAVAAQHQPAAVVEEYPAHVDPTWQATEGYADVAALVHPTAQPFPAAAAPAVEGYPVEAFPADELPTESDLRTTPSMERPPVDRDHPAAQFFPPADPSGPPPRRPSPRPRRTPVDEGQAYAPSPSGLPEPQQQHQGFAGEPTQVLPDGAIGQRSGLAMPGSPILPGGPAPHGGAVPPGGPVPSGDPAAHGGFAAHGDPAAHGGPAPVGGPAVPAARPHVAPLPNGAAPQAAPPHGAAPHAAPGHAAPPPRRPLTSDRPDQRDHLEHRDPAHPEPLQPVERSEGRRAHPDAALRPDQPIRTPGPGLQPPVLREPALRDEAPAPREWAPEPPARADWADGPTASVPTVANEPTVRNDPAPHADLAARTEPTLRNDPAVRVDPTAGSDWVEPPTEIEDWSDAPTNTIPAVVDEWSGHPEAAWSADQPAEQHSTQGWTGPSAAARTTGTVTAEPDVEDPVASIFGPDDDRDPPSGRRSSRRVQATILATLVILLVAASAVATWLFLTA
ncbi:hypothetical protein Val02_88960 [Virgisporangium aliadipatigenens]|uniref:Serine/threonine protein phosphatase PstP n=1 Tax=Virgisporangium aliadipatigenens TaxID=741659 RepID=A0A8J3YYG6_9ACTN|nr:hypothetical protein Val02_88960 [Virgisporangium aliadipatigenens]